MTLTELQNEVYILTNRPDLVNETLSAVRAATLKLHQADYFYKDLFETGVVFSTAEYQQALEYRTLLPRWRSLKYIRKTDASGSSNGAFFDIIVPESILDDYQQNRVNVCYVAGSVVQMKSSTQFQYVILGAYLNPDITVSGYNSWIALDHPYAIIYEAAATIFKSIGEDTSSTAMRQLAMEYLAEVKISNIQAQGY